MIVKIILPDLIAHFFSRFFLLKKKMMKFQLIPMTMALAAAAEQVRGRVFVSERFVLKGGDVFFMFYKSLHNLRFESVEC